MSAPPLKPRTATKRAGAVPTPLPPTWFEPLLLAVTHGKTQMALRKGSTVYSQGQPADSTYFLQRGKVRLSVLSSSGKEAILGILEPGGFCGEGCLTGQPRRIGSAVAITPVSVLRIEKSALVRALHEQHPLSEAVLAQLLIRNLAFEEDICDQLFNHSEKRLARALLKLARFGEAATGHDGHVISPLISQESLAEMIGTTRSRVNFFMNKFRRLGLIDYNGEIRVHTALLTDIVLSE